MNKETSWVDNPHVVLKLWVLFHLAAWTMFPLVINSCLPLDTMKMVLQGGGLQWGYAQMPPLVVWMAQGMHSMAGDLGLYFFSQLCVVLAGFGIFRIARFLGLSTRSAFFSVLLLDALCLFPFFSLQFNTSAILLPLWSWGWYFGLHAEKEQKITSWIALGLCLGLGLLGNALSIFMLLPLFVFWWMRGNLNGVFRQREFYFAGAIAFALFFPHLQWLMKQDEIGAGYDAKMFVLGLAPLFLSLGLGLLSRWKLERFPRFVISAAVASNLLCLAGYFFFYGVQPAIQGKFHPRNYPATLLAQATERTWHQSLAVVPFRTVVADEFLGGIVSLYGKDHPTLISIQSGSLSPSKEEHIRRGGALVIWLKSEDFSAEHSRSLEEVYPELSARFPHIQSLSDLILPWPRARNHQAARYGLAIIPPGG